MRKILIAALLLSPTLLLAQTEKLTLDDILGGAGGGAGSNSTRSFSANFAVAGSLGAVVPTSA